MSIQVEEFYTSGPHWKRTERRWNPGTFGQDDVVVHEEGHPGRGAGLKKRRKAAAAVIEHGGEKALALSGGHVYDVTLLVAGEKSSVRLDLKRSGSLQLRPSTEVVSVLGDAEPVLVEYEGGGVGPRVPLADDGDDDPEQAGAEEEE